MLLQLLDGARKRSRRGQGGFTLVELLVVIAILGILAAIVLFNISGVNASAACNAMRTDGATIQGAADLYYNNLGVYPVGPPPVGQVDNAVTPNASSVNVTDNELAPPTPPGDGDLHVHHRRQLWQRHGARRPRWRGVPLQPVTLGLGIGSAGLVAGRSVSRLLRR
jgi:prepilin-type N-terminal cleavage/methylation domain-containing protein